MLWVGVGLWYYNVCVCCIAMYVVGRCWSVVLQCVCCITMYVVGKCWSVVLQCVCCIAMYVVGGCWSVVLHGVCGCVCTYMSRQFRVERTELLILESVWKLCAFIIL